MGQQVYLLVQFNYDECLHFGVFANRRDAMDAKRALAAMRPEEFGYLTVEGLPLGELDPYYAQMLATYYQAASVHSETGT